MHSKTRKNLEVALAGEADANRRYTAYGIRALHEGYPEIAQLFFEAAGAETVHAYSHLLALDAIGTTEQNLRTAAIGELDEIEVVYPRMIAEAEAEGDLRAAASFRLALDREKHHRQMFRSALDSFRPLPAEVPKDGDTSRTAMTQPRSTTMAGGRLISPPSKDRLAPVEFAERSRNVSELESERARISRLAGIREVVFGSQDGLISTTTLVAGLTATTSNNLVVLVAGAIAAVGGALSMGVGSYLSSRAQKQVYESELERERTEIAEKPGEETAELIAALAGRGMPRRDAAEVVRRVAVHPQLMMDMLGVFELGLTPESLGSPVKDAFVMSLAFVIGSAAPLLAFLIPDVATALGLAMILALLTLFGIGALKGRLSSRSVLRSGFEVMLVGGAAGVTGYLLGKAVSLLFGLSI